jgi:hypothetical protein
MTMIKKAEAALDVRSEELSSASATRPLWSVWNKSLIARLTAVQISRMNRQTLAKLVEYVHNELPQTIASDRLQTLDRQTLERLSFVARRICRDHGY